MSELIPDRWFYDDDDLVSYDQDDHDQIRDLFLGHRIAKIADDHGELDDGTVFRVVANEGCGGCSSGWYSLDDLNGCDNIVTRVEFDEDAGDDEYEPDRTYKVFVVAEDKRINLYAVTGNDGNGYYGTGYELIVRKA